MVRTAARRRRHRRSDRQEMPRKPPDRQRVAQATRPTGQPPALRTPRHGADGRHLRPPTVHPQARHALRHLPSGHAYLAVRGRHRAPRHARPPTASTSISRICERVVQAAPPSGRSPTISQSAPKRSAAGSPEIHEAAPTDHSAPEPLRASTYHTWQQLRRRVAPTPTPKIG
jgi:hypothetical protein